MISTLSKNIKGINRSKVKVKVTKNMKITLVVETHG